MTVNKRSVGILAGLVLAGIPCVSSAAAIISYGTGTGTSSIQTYAWNGAIDVMIGADPITISQLGVDDYLGNGFEGSQTAYIAIYNGGTPWLVSVDVSSADPLAADGYRYATLGTPFVMAANTNYFVGARLTGGTSFVRTNGGTSWTPGVAGVTYTNGSFFNNDSPPTSVAPNNYGFNDHWAPANAMPVPEPSSLALLGAAAGFLVRRRRH